MRKSLPPLSPVPAYVTFVDVSSRGGVAVQSACVRRRTSDLLFFASVAVDASCPK